MTTKHVLGACAWIRRSVDLKDKNEFKIVEIGNTLNILEYDEFCISFWIDSFQFQVANCCSVSYECLREGSNRNYDGLGQGMHLLYLVDPPRHIPQCLNKSMFLKVTGLLLCPKNRTIFPVNLFELYVLYIINHNYVLALLTQKYPFTISFIFKSITRSFIHTHNSFSSFIIISILT